jgi:hypothetical protein
MIYLHGPEIPHCLKTNINCFMLFVYNFSSVKIFLTVAKAKKARGTSGK